MAWPQRSPPGSREYSYPSLSLSGGELKTVNARIDALKISMEEMDRRLTSQIQSLRNEMIAKFEAVNSRIDSLEKRLDVAERLAVIEAKLREHDEILKKIT